MASVCHQSVGPRSGSCD